MKSFFYIIRIISGGQVGVDRAALDFAIANSIPHGGYCPKGRRAIDGAIPDRYQLTELSVTSYSSRTRRNIEHSDMTLLISPTPMGPGSELTLLTCEDQKKECLLINPANKLRMNVIDVAEALERVKPKVLNVAGSRLETMHSYTLLLLNQVKLISNIL